MDSPSSFKRGSGVFSPENLAGRPVPPDVRHAAIQFTPFPHANCFSNVVPAVVVFLFFFKTHTERFAPVARHGIAASAR
jgi:hypothetical protein